MSDAPAPMVADILTPVSPGELLDKITILELKRDRIADAAKTAHVRHELSLLEETARKHLPASERLDQLMELLRSVNAKLWEIEDDIRLCERNQDFGKRFIALARSVYMTNDERAALKKAINLHLGSTIVEEKSYEAY